MKSITVITILLSIIALFFADLDIVSLNPFYELNRIFDGITHPNFTILLSLKSAILNTIIFAIIGIFISVIFGTVLSFFYTNRVIRYFATAIRSIHEIFWAFLLLPIFGLTSITGVLAIAIPYIGIFAKRYAEIYQETDLTPYHALPKNSNIIVRLVYGIIPLTFGEISNYTRYRFECALRSSAVLGFIGLPTIGFHLETYFSEGMYREAVAILLLFYLLIYLLKFTIRKRIIPLYIIVSLLLISKDIHFKVENLIRFFTVDIIPWPIKRAGLWDGTHSLIFNISDIISWLIKIINNDIIPGLLNTIILTQISLTLTGALVIVLLVSASKQFLPKVITSFINIILIIMRTTPEYIIAFVAIQIWGPSMIPGIIALVIHNGAIITFLTVKRMDSIKIPIDRPKSIIKTYLFIIIPQIYGTLLSNLLYRLEVMVRESSLLRVLGIYTLGFYVDSGISDGKMDRALIVIISIALLNILIDTASQKMRKHINSSDIYLAE